MIEVWPDNWDAVRAFGRLMTQWMISGMGGPTGLAYASIPFVLELLGIARDDWLQVFDDIRTMEIEALNCMAEQRKNVRG